MKNRYLKPQNYWVAISLLISVLSGCDAPTDPSQDEGAPNNSSVQPQGVEQSSSQGGVVFVPPTLSTSSTESSSSQSEASSATIESSDSSTTSAPVVSVPPETSSQPSSRPASANPPPSSSSSQSANTPPSSSSASNSISSSESISTTSSSSSSTQISSSSSTEPDSSSSSSSSSVSVSNSTSSSSSTSNSNIVADGKSQFDQVCSGCHADLGNGVFSEPSSTFSVHEFTYPTNHQGFTADDPEGLSQFITAKMQFGGPCINECAQAVADYLWSLRDVPPAAKDPITIQRGELVNERLSLDIHCAENTAPIELQITSSGPRFDFTNLDQFTPVSVTDLTITEVSEASILSRLSSDTLSITGNGLDIWDTNVSFNGLSVDSTGTFDIGLNIQSVANVAHPYAKVGILVSSTESLDGDLLFLHWSGQNGLAEDFGSGALNNYRQLAENPAGVNSQTPTPTVLRFKYSSGTFEVGGCYDCDTPELQAAAADAFKPQTIFVVASAHAENTIESTIQLINFAQPMNVRYNAECESDEQTVSLENTAFANENNLNVQLFVDGGEQSNIQVERSESTVSSSSSSSTSSEESSATTTSSSEASSTDASSSESASSEASTSSAESSASSMPDMSHADELYEEQCASCHGELGIGSFYTELYECDICDDREALFEEILNEMPPGRAGDCGEECSDVLSHYIFNDFFAEPPAEEEEKLSCEVESDLLAPKLRRLSQNEFRATVENIFGSGFDDNIWPNFNDSLPTLGMSNNAELLSIDSQNLQTVYYSVDAIVDQILAENDDVAACLENGSRSCLNSVIDQYAPLAWRRPITEAEKSELLASLDALVESGGNFIDQLEFTFKALLLSKNFLFRYELGDATSGVSALTDYEIASLLSYSLWGTPPDSTLYAKAAAGELNNPSEIESQVTRMIESANFQKTLLEFFKDYLKLDKILTVEKLDKLGLTDDIRAALLASTENTLVDNLANLDANINDILDTERFYINDTIAPLFGLPSSDFGAGFTNSNAANQERNGLLTHPAFLSVHSKEGSSGIVKRGVFNLLQMMCLDLGDPPENLTEMPLPTGIVPELTSSRELLHLQHSSQTECAACHKFIDPAGFGFENYDAIGMFREVEKEIVPIDASGTLTARGETLTFNDSIEFTEELMNSEIVKACLTKRYLEHFSGQTMSENSCEYKNLNHSLTTKGDVSIRAIIQSISTLESLRIRGTR